MTTLFQAVERVLADGESLKITLARHANGLKLAVQPILVKEPEDASEDIQRIRAGLAMPLMMQGNATQLDEQFLSILTQYADARQETHTNLDALLSTLKESSKHAVKAKSTSKTHGTPEKPRGKKVRVEKTSVDAKPSVEPEEPENNPETLATTNPSSIL